MNHASAPGALSHSDAARLRLRRLGRQITLAREGKMSQTDLGTRLSKYLGDDVAQASISRWEKGQVDLGVEQVRALELVLNYKPGDLLVAANYVQRESNPQSSREFVMTDPALHPDLRKDAFNAYQAFLNASMRMFDSDRRMDLQA